MEDRRFRLLAHSAHDGPVDAVRRDTILRRAATPAVVARLDALGIASAREPLRLPAAPELGMGERVCLPVRDRETLLGYVWVLDDPPLTDPELQRLATALAPVGPALVALRDREDERAAREQLALAAALGGDPADAASLLVEATPVAVVVAASRADLGAVRRRAGAGRTLIGEVAGLAIALTTGPDAAPAPPAPTAGVGGPVATLAEAPEAFRQARLAYRVSLAVPALGPVARFAALGPYALLAPLAFPESGPPAPLPPALVTLRGAPDASELLTTLRAVFEEDVGGAAARLHVHRSTLHRRLQRIEQLTGADLADGRTRLELHAGLLLAELLG